MNAPNLYIYNDSNGTFGLHRFKADGELYITKLVTSYGDWQIICKPTKEQIEKFEKYGIKQKPNGQAQL